jgi:hypothetical protein
MTNSQLVWASPFVGVYKNMTNGQFYRLEILTVGQFCDTMIIGKQNDR